MTSPAATLTMARVSEVLRRMADLAEEDVAMADAFADFMDVHLDAMLDKGDFDGASTYGLRDPRGVQQEADEPWTMWNVEGIDNKFERE